MKIVTSEPVTNTSTTNATAPFSKIFLFSGTGLVANLWGNSIGRSSSKQLVIPPMSFKRLRLGLLICAFMIHSFAFDFEPSLPDHMMHCDISGSLFGDRAQVYFSCASFSCIYIVDLVRDICMTFCKSVRNSSLGKFGYERCMVPFWKVRHLFLANGCQTRIFGRQKLGIKPSAFSDSNERAAEGYEGSFSNDWGAV